MLGTALASEASGHLVSSAGTRVPVEVSAVALKNGERVVGVFGLFEERPDDSTKAPPRISPPVKSRCCVYWSRAARRSRSPPSSI